MRFLWEQRLENTMFDWTVTADDYEPGQPVGYGRTIDEAIDDLIFDELSRELAVDRNVGDGS